MGGAAVMLIRGRPTALNLLMRRALMLGLIAAGIAAVLAPSAVTALAKTVGVGRGADLVLYILCVTFLFVSISLYLRLGQLHDRQVELARRYAIMEAELRQRDERETRP